MHLCGEKKIASVGRESGQSMIESIICMFVILLLLFSFLELFNLSLARMVTDYASMTAARSAAVGFSPYLARRRARCAAIPASGKRTRPDSSGWSYGSYSTSSMDGSMVYEKELINQYIPGYMWIEYEYWYGDNSDSNNIYNDATTTLSVNEPVRNSDLVGWLVRFNDYPSYNILNMFFTGHSSFQITGEEADDINYAPQFLDSN